MDRVRSHLTILLALLALTAPTASAQTLTPLNALVATNGTITAGDLTFSNFRIPLVPPPSVTVPLGVPTPLPEFGDIAVTASVGPDGTTALSFVAVDPATGLPAPLTTGPTAGGEKFRAVSYTVSVNNPGRRIHAMNQRFGPASAITGDSALIDGLYAVEPVPAVYDLLMQDITNAPPDVSRSTPRPPADPATTSLGAGAILLPGGNLATYDMACVFGLIKGHLGFDAGGSLDAVTETFSLVPDGTPVPPVVPTVAAIVVNSSGIATIVLSDFAPDGGALVALGTSDPGALKLPASVTIPQGYMLAAVSLPELTTVDGPTPVTISATVNGVATTQAITVSPATPLLLSGVGAGTQTATGIQFGTVTAAGATVAVALSRENFSPATVALASSNPAVAPVPSAITIPAFTVPGDFRLTSVFVPFAAVAVDTPLTFSATFNGETRTTTVVVPKTSDRVRIAKAEQVVKNGALKVEATGSNPAATLSLFNADTGAFIGVMSFNGLSGSGAKFSFQGTTAPVTSLRLVSSLNGSDTGAVSRK